MSRAFCNWVYPKLLDMYFKGNAAERALYIDTLMSLRPVAEGNEEGMREIVDVALKAMWMAKNGLCIHFFFDGDNFVEWLKKCHTPLSSDMCAVAKQFGDDMLMLASRLGVSREIAKQLYTPIMFHFRGGNSEPYLVVWLDGFVDSNTGAVLNKPIAIVLRVNGTGFWFCPEMDGDVKINEDGLRTQQFVASCMAYIQAFPECVQHGLPQAISQPNHYRGQAVITATVAEELIEHGTHGSPIPHYRIGHFRCFTAERYKAARGRVVFVRGMFVKGRAETVNEIGTL